MHIDNRFLGEQFEMLTKKYIITISRIADDQVQIQIINRKKGTRKIFILGQEEKVIPPSPSWLKPAN